MICLILFTGTTVWIDSVMRPRSSSRGRNTTALVTVIDKSAVYEYDQYETMHHIVDTCLPTNEHYIERFKTLHTTD